MSANRELSNYCRDHSSNMNSPPLTPNAISHMLAVPHGQAQALVLQVTQVTPSYRQGMAQLHLTDGLRTLKARLSIKQPFMDITKIGKPFGREPKYRIMVTEHVTHNFEGTRILEIVSYTPLDPPDLPHPYSQQLHGEPREHPSPPHDYSLEMVGGSRSTIISGEGPETIQEEHLREYEKISDLYVDFPGWKLIVRVIDKSYKEFKSKTDKLIKVCNIQLMDKTMTKIEASLFGEQAKGFFNTVKTGTLYRIENGQVKENTYNQQRDQLHSRHTIILNPLSLLTELKERGECVPTPKDPSLTIPQLLEVGVCERQYEVVGILLELGEERSIERDGRTIYKQHGLLGDPLSRKSMELILWNRNIELDQNLLRHTVVLKNFKLSKYRDLLSLGSVFKSEIRPRYDHPYSAYEEREIRYSSISAGRAGEGGLGERVCKSVKDLEEEIHYMSASQSLHSELEVWVTFLNVKGKWHYGACNNPKCKKSADSHSRCIYCGSYNQAISQKFILPVEISDWTGSLWVTAFDDFAGELFRGWTLDDLILLDEFQLKEECERRCFRQFKARVATRREKGTIRHSLVGKPVEMGIEKATESNIERIRRALG